MSTAPLIVLFLTIGSAIAGYILTVRNEKQSDNIERLAKLNATLSDEIKNLSKINNDIATNSASITAENKILATQNVELTKKSNLLIKNVGELTVQSKLLISKIDTRTEKDIEENKIAGEFNFIFDKPIYSLTDIKIELGQNIKMPATTTPFIIGNFVPIGFLVKENKFLLNVDIVDFNQVSLLEINENRWRINPRYKNKFNYDSKGFELIDDKENVILSFNILPDNTIRFRGIIPYGNNSAILIDKNGMQPIDGIIKNPKLYQNAATTNDQLFQYTGEHWLHIENKTPFFSILLDIKPTEKHENVYLLLPIIE